MHSLSCLILLGSYFVPIQESGPITLRLQPEPNTTYRYEQVNRFTMDAFGEQVNPSDQLVLSLKTLESGQKVRLRFTVDSRSDSQGLASASEFRDLILVMSLSPEYKLLDLQREGEDIDPEIRERVTKAVEPMWPKNLPAGPIRIGQEWENEMSLADILGATDEDAPAELREAKLQLKSKLERVGYVDGRRVAQIGEQGTGAFKIPVEELNSEVSVSFTFTGVTLIDLATGMTYKGSIDLKGNIDTGFGEINMTANVRNKLIETRRDF